MPSGTSEEHTTLLVKVIMEAISTGSGVKNMIGCVSSAQLYPCVDISSVAIIKLSFESAAVLNRL
jgi:hypothetical protein